MQCIFLNFKNIFFWFFVFNNGNEYEIESSKILSKLLDAYWGGIKSETAKVKNYINCANHNESWEPQWVSGHLYSWILPNVYRVAYIPGCIAPRLPRHYIVHFVSLAHDFVSGDLTRTSQKVTHLDSAPTQACLTEEFPLNLSSLWLQNVLRLVSPRFTYIPSISFIHDRCGICLRCYWFRMTRTESLTQ